jgi:hypothetical protein
MTDSINVQFVQSPAIVVKTDIGQIGVQIAAQGLAGPPGPAGPPGDVTFTFPQAMAAAIWDVNHNLNRFPSVTVVDSSGRQMEGQVDYIDANNIRLTFSVPFAGDAYLN